MDNRHVISDVYTVRCPICGKPYQVITTMGGDQSACPKCVREGMQNTYGSGYNTCRDYLNNLPKTYS